jgi:hypothetical protein
MNGIWVCHSCSDIIDKDPERYTAAMLRLAKRRHEAKIKAEQLGKPRDSEALASLQRLVLEQIQAEQLRTAEKVAERKEHLDHRRWADAVIASLRAGGGNARLVPIGEEDHARWAIRRGMLAGMEWPNGLHVMLRQGPFEGDDNEDVP